MRVKILTRLKNGPEFIDIDTVFEGTEKTLPDFVLYELERDRGTVEILPDLIQRKKKKAVQRSSPKNPVKPEAGVKPSTKEKPPSLREKLTDTEK
jgi:hypothetical protein